MSSSAFGEGFSNVLAEAMAKKGAQVSAIDLAAKLLKVAELHALESGVSVHYRQMSAEELAPQEAGRYDVVTCMEMLEHVPDPASVVEACARLLKPGGRLLTIVGQEPVMRAVSGVSTSPGATAFTRRLRPA